LLTRIVSFLLNTSFGKFYQNVMDVADVVSGDAAMRVPAQELVDLVSEEEDEEDRSTAGAPSKTPAATIEAGSDEEDSEEDWELDSVLEDTIQGMGNSFLRWRIL
jgi:hypothetical protein